MESTVTVSGHKVSLANYVSEDSREGRILVIVPTKKEYREVFVYFSPMVGGVGLL